MLNTKEEARGIQENGLEYSIVKADPLSELQFQVYVGVVCPSDKHE